MNWSRTLGNNNQSSILIGAIAAVCVVFFWSGWIVISRIGVTHHLTVYDVTGLRFSIGAAVALPYIIWQRAWRRQTPGQVVFAETIVSAVFNIPVWLLWLDSNLAVAPGSEILLQGAYQGLVPSILGISCLNVAVRHIGAHATSVFLSVVPVVAALAAIPILQEMPGLPAWIGMITVTVGILLALGIIGLNQSFAAACE